MKGLTTDHIHILTTLSKKPQHYSTLRHPGMSYSSLELIRQLEDQQLVEWKSRVDYIGLTGWGKEIVGVLNSPKQ